MVKNKLNDIINNKNSLSLINRNLKTLLKVPLNNNLTSLNLHFNQIYRIECLHMCPRLTNLNLSSNNITTIEGLNSLTFLEILNLSCNLINVVQNLEKLSNLKCLDLSYNKLKNVDGLDVFHNSSLTSLYLEGNKIDNLHNTISVLKPITTLKKLVLDDANTRHFSNVPSTTAIDDIENDQNSFVIQLQNPICQLQEYRTNVLECLPNLNSLDYMSNKNNLHCMTSKFDVCCDIVCDDDCLVSEVSSQCSELVRLMKEGDLEESATPTKDVGQQSRQTIDISKRPVFEKNIHTSKIPRLKKNCKPLIIPPLDEKIIKKHNLNQKNRSSSRGDGILFAGSNNNNAASINTPVKDNMDPNIIENDCCKDAPSINHSHTNINENNKSSMSMEKYHDSLKGVLEDCSKQKNKKWKKKTHRSSMKKNPNDLEVKGIIQLKPILSQKGYKKPKKHDGYTDTFGVNMEMEKHKAKRENDCKAGLDGSEVNSCVGFYDGEELTKMLLEEKERNKELREQ